MALTSLTSLNSLTSPFAKVELIIFCFYLEVALWVVANGAYLGSFLTNNDVSTVGTLPDAIAIARKDNLVFYILQEFAITLFMVLLYLCHHRKLGGYLVETLSTGFFCHALIHIGPLAILALSRG